jgi:pentatricopeptide repeat protein
MSERDVVSWNAMIAGYAQNGQDSEALALFRQMQMSGVKLNSVTIVSVLPACTHLAALQQVKSIHDYIIRTGIEVDAFVGSALISMYAKCGSLKIAHVVFEGVSQRALVLWNSLIGGYVQNGHVDESLNLFRQMQLQGLKPDPCTVGMCRMDT